MNFTRFPITRQRLQNLRGGAEDDSIRKRLDAYVREISYGAVDWAKRGLTSQYIHILPKDIDEITFYTLNVSILLERIRANFPDSKVQFTSMLEMTDGSMLDCYTIDSRIYPYIQYKKLHTCVTVDWA